MHLENSSYIKIVQAALYLFVNGISNWAQIFVSRFLPKQICKKTFKNVQGLGKFLLCRAVLSTAQF